MHSLSWSYKSRKCLSTELWVLLERWERGETQPGSGTCIQIFLSCSHAAHPSVLRLPFCFHVPKAKTWGSQPKIPYEMITFDFQRRWVLIKIIFNLWEHWRKLKHLKGLQKVSNESYYNTTVLVSSAKATLVCFFTTDPIFQGVFSIKKTCFLVYNFLDTENHYKWFYISSIRILQKFMLFSFILFSCEPFNCNMKSFLVLKVILKVLFMLFSGIRAFLKSHHSDKR